MNYFFKKKILNKVGLKHIYLYGTGLVQFPLYCHLTLFEIHPHIKRKIYTSETPCIFSLIRLPIIWNQPCTIPFVLSSYTRRPSCVLL